MIQELRTKHVYHIVTIGTHLLSPMLENPHLTSYSILYAGHLYTVCLCSVLHHAQNCDSNSYMLKSNNSSELLCL